MDDFSLADAIGDDVPGKASKTSHTNPAFSGGAAHQPTNPGWPGAAPGGPQMAPASGPTQPSAPPGPGAPGPFPGAPLPGSEFSGHYPGPSGGFPHGPGAPPQYPSGPGAPGHAPGQFPGFPSGMPGPYPSGPGAPPGPFPNAPYSGPPPAGMYGPGAPGSFPPPAAGPGPYAGFPSGAFPPIPSGSWGTHGPGGFPAQPAHPGSYGPGFMGPFGDPAYGGQPAPGGMLSVPHHMPLHAGMMPRLLITIEGEAPLGADRFHVDFVKGQDVVFHLNPRFSEQTVVRNAFLRGSWGPEERHGGFPFSPGRRFELKILVEEEMFKVALDGSHFLEFEHRVGGLEEVTLVRVEGDVMLYSVAPSMI